MNTSGLSRRKFLKTALGAAAVASTPLIIPSRLLGANSPSNRVRVAHIGCGRIATGHDMPGVLNSGLADYIAVCDLDSKRVAQAKHYIQNFKTASNHPRPDIDTYSNYRELLERKDIDAVVISTPDHWHAQLALAAIYSGKDVYLQKPMTMTHAEGQALRDAIAKTDRIFQIGSQQRSWVQFRKACELVRNGRVGRLNRIEIGLPIDPTAPDNPEQTIPSNLDYDTWLGPTPEAYYTEQRVHPQNSITNRPGWLRHEAHCLGMITGWGAHHYDTAHWAMDVEHTGPSRIEATAEFPKNKIWNVHGAYHVELDYPNNVKVVVTDKFNNGLKFIGDEGWIWVTRDSEITPSDPTAKLSKAIKALDASDPKLLDPNGLSLRLPVSTEHHLNWLECVKSRATPIAPAPVAHRSNAACIISWIAMKLGRPLNWDPVAERFINDEQANAMLSLPQRGSFGIHTIIKS